MAFRRLAPPGRTFGLKSPSILEMRCNFRCWSSLWQSLSGVGKWSAVANTHVVWPVSAVLDNNFLWWLLNDEGFWVKGEALSHS